MMIKLLIYVLVLAFVSPVWAGSWGQGLGRGMGYGLGPCADPDLNLSPEQASRMKVIQSDYQKSIRPLQMEFQDKRIELKMCEPGREKIRSGPPSFAIKSGSFREDSRDLASL